jgi:hypothetical protein
MTRGNGTQSALQNGDWTDHVGVILVGTLQAVELRLGASVHRPYP